MMATRVVLDPMSMNLPVVDVSPPKTTATGGTQGKMDFDNFDGLIGLVREFTTSSLTL